MTERPRHEITAHAARAARQAAAEAATPEARTFLRAHANRLARLAASARRRATVSGRTAVIALLPVADALPV